jgi:hypothetical protein
MSNSNILYNKVFTGEIAPVVINMDTINSPNTNFGTIASVDATEVSLIKWRDIVRKHLPSNANLATVECELKLEYLHFDYIIPSRVVVPSSALPEMGRRDTLLQKQVKTLEFKNKYNRTGNYAYEFRLIKLYCIDYTLNPIHNPNDNYYNQIPYNIELDYPIGDLIYNNRLPSFLNLLPYLAKDNPIVFADVKQELRVQIIPSLGLNDLLIFAGGYSGSVTYELLSSTVTVTKSEVITLTGQGAVKVLNNNPNRYGFYLCNNGTTNIFYSFSSNAGIGGGAKLILKPGETLIYEDKKLTLNNSNINPGDNRFMLGSPLWVRNSLPGSNDISIEEITYT